MNKDAIIFSDKLASSLYLKSLPDEVIISTMTVICKVGTKFNLPNIGQYLDLKNNAIVRISYGNPENKTTNRGLFTKKNVNPKKKKKLANFYNQVTVIIRMDEGNKDINVKLFLNGSIQMTGCKSVKNIVESLDKLFIGLKTIKAIVDFKTNEIIEKPFVDDVTKIDFANISMADIKIPMINSNFNIGFQIDRDKLFEILDADNLNLNVHDCSYDPDIHACVNIKYNHVEKIVSIFVFEKGPIIITGAKNCKQIYDAYMFINNYLLQNFKKIRKQDILDSQLIKIINQN
jgi:TATA-box binding protein (TBP) (component of TFIID and TFIIIB)